MNIVFNNFKIDFLSLKENSGITNNWWAKYLSEDEMLIIK
jgi:hypothetical protein